MPTSPVLFIANHKSYNDALLFYIAIYERKQTPLVSFLAKEELHSSSLINSAITLIDGIYIERDNLRQSLEAINNTKKILTGWVDNELEIRYFPKSVCIFAEGTRLPKNEIGPFKAGTLKPAYQTYKAILPVAISNSLGSKIRFWNKKVTIEFCKRIEAQSFFTVPSNVLANKIRNIIADAYSANSKIELKK